MHPTSWKRHPSCPCSLLQPHSILPSPYSWSQQLPALRAPKAREVARSWPGEPTGFEQCFQLIACSAAASCPVRNAKCHWQSLGPKCLGEPLFCPQSHRDFASGRNAWDGEHKRTSWTGAPIMPLKKMKIRCQQLLWA